MERLMGVETEYAVSGAAPVEVLVRELTRAARERLVHLTAGRPSDLFLANGGRFYVDCGGHPELCTPECLDPAEAARYVLAGERILEDLRDGLAGADERLATMRLFKTNVDYVSGTTWACHESYLTTRDPRQLQAALVPHLASRIVYTGGGGFESRGKWVEFSLSPRTSFLEHVISPESTGQRGLFHTKNESLARRGFHRLHVLCGESVCSQTGLWLKLGTTALVVALAEADRVPVDLLRCLRDPLAAMRAFAADPECRARAATRDGEASALQLQRRYLEATEAEVGGTLLPAWAADVCRAWRAILDRLENGPEAVERTLDWALKRRLFQRHAERRGVSLARLARWAHPIAVIQRALLARPGTHRIEDVIAPASPIADTIRALDPYLESHGLRWDELRPAFDFRTELLEIDARFGELHACSPFRALDEAGALDHRIAAIGDVEAACTCPPRAGRAHTRGEMVRAHAGQRGFTCGWDMIWDHAGKRMLSLTHPFQTSTRWRATRGIEWLAELMEPDEDTSLEALEAMRQRTSQ